MISVAAFTGISVWQNAGTTYASEEGTGGQ